MRAVTLLTFGAENDGERPFAEVCDVLGKFAAGSLWRIRLGECAGQPQAMSIAQDLAAAETMVPWSKITALATLKLQLIDAQLWAFRIAGDTRPWFVLESVDNMHWDFYSEDQSVLSHVLAVYPDARPAPELVGPEMLWDSP